MIAREDSAMENLADFRETCARAKEVWLKIIASGGPLLDVERIYYGLAELMRMVEHGGPQTPDEVSQLETLLPDLEWALECFDPSPDGPRLLVDDRIDTPAELLGWFERTEAAAGDGRHAGDLAHPHRMELLGMLRQRVRFGGTPR